MRSTRPGAAALAVVVLTGCSLVQASPGSLVVSGPAAGDLFVHGVVRRDGAPVVGAEVSLLIEELGAHTAYDVPAVTTGEAGGYAFYIDPEELPARFMLGEDHVNFDVAAVDGTDRSTWSSTVWLVDDSAGWRGQGADVDDAVPAVSFDLGHGTVEVTDSSGERATYGE